MLTKQEKIDLLKKADDLDINIEFCQQSIVTSYFETEQSEYPDFVDDIENQYYYTTYPDSYEDDGSHYWVFEIPADKTFKAHNKDEFWTKLQEAIKYTIDYRTKRGLSLYD